MRELPVGSSHGTQRDYFDGPIPVQIATAVFGLIALSSY